jgi:hypothetical protein
MGEQKPTLQEIEQRIISKSETKITVEEQKVVLLNFLLFDSTVF